jgi:hypothetical protein|tara:strand:- start:106 stop:345 length:240 start_codon:yes stop_codon:yes gene_type:complete
MKDFFATMLALAIIFGTVWGIIVLFAMSVNFLVSIGIPSGMLYFSTGIIFAGMYKRIGKWFGNYCNTVWEKLYQWIVWR